MTHTHIQAAVAAGIPVVGLTTGQEASTLIAAGANLVVADFDALMAVIDRKGASNMPP